MLNFAQSAPSNMGVPRGQYQQPQIPAGTRLLATLDLHNVPFCFNPQSQFVAQDQTSGLLKFFFELTVIAPREYAGQKIGGSKPMTEAIQRQMGINGDFAQCAKGDRAVHAIIACDAMVKNRAPEYSISSYRNLDGLVCAVEIGSFKGKTCIRNFLDPTDSRDRNGVQMLIEMAAQSDPGRLPDVPASWPDQPQPDPMAIF